MSRLVLDTMSLRQLCPPMVLIFVSARLLEYNHYTYYSSTTNSTHNELMNALNFRNLIMNMIEKMMQNWMPEWLNLSHIYRVINDPSCLDMTFVNWLDAYEKAWLNRCEASKRVWSKSAVALVCSAAMLDLALLRWCEAQLRTVTHRKWSPCCFPKLINKIRTKQKIRKFFPKKIYIPRPMPEPDRPAATRVKQVLAKSFSLHKTGLSLGAQTQETHLKFSSQ